MHSNRLAREKSPYLLQHAHNPVDWYPWSDEAFEKARRENKPIFLSIGYSTCHWCHVMERESFENDDLAAVLNASFVSIKVDREERPDIDGIYMQAVMQMTGHGGWPLSVFLTPDKKPFYGGTYFPPEDRWGQPGFKSLLRGVMNAWENKRAEIEKSASGMTKALALGEEGQAHPPESEPAGRAVFDRAFMALESVYDSVHGGFGDAPKFPRPHLLFFLNRYARRAKNPRALEMVEGTLRAMAAGGICDQLGGGFHRYSTDAHWHLPHFEKMLYDQALLAIAYLEAYQITGKQEYAQTARAIFDYVLRDMTSPEGGFYSAEDADSAVDASQPKRKHEGAFYVWMAKEIEQLLDSESAAVFSYAYGIGLHGNVTEDPTGEFPGKNHLYRARSLTETAQHFKKPEPEIESILKEARVKLLQVRTGRPRPHLDDKILADWNGWMIAAFALGGRVLQEPRYTQAAERAMQFILRSMVRSDGRLLHRWRGGEAAIPAMLDDYAFLAHASIELYQTTGKTTYLAKAVHWTRRQIELFWQEEPAGFFLTAHDAEQLLLRPKEWTDGAIPSGNSMAAVNLLRLGRMTGESDFEKRAEQMLRAQSAAITRNPTAYPQALAALDFLWGPTRELVLAGSADDPVFQRMRAWTDRTFLPDTIVLYHTADAEGQALEKVAPFVKPQIAPAGKTAAYLCEGRTCQAPVGELDSLKQRFEFPSADQVQ